MYKVKPVSERIVIQSIPTTMYKVKSYVIDSTQATTSQTETISDSQVEELGKQLNNQLKRLEKLCAKTNDLCDELSLNNLVVNTDSNKLSQQKNTNQSSKLDENRLASFAKEQDALLKRMENLTLKTNKVCENLKLSNLLLDMSALSVNANTKSSQTIKKSTTDSSSGTVAAEQPRETLKVDLSLFKNVQRATTKQNKDKPIEDIVINVDPTIKNYTPRLFSFLDQLTLNYKCFFQFQRHNSIQAELKENATLRNRLHNFVDLFEALQLNSIEPRSKYDFSFTYIFRKSENPVPYLSFSSLEKEKVVGEAAILEYLNKSLPSERQVDLAKLKLDGPLSKVLESFY